MINLTLHVLLESDSRRKLSATLGATSRTTRIQVRRSRRRLTQFYREGLNCGRGELHWLVVLRVLARMTQQLTLVVEDHFALANHAVDLNREFVN